MAEHHGFRVGEIASMTSVKAGTIRFYEKCGFLEPVERLSNGYRNYSLHHMYQVKICHLVFEEFVNKYLRKISYDIISAASQWDLPAYALAVKKYQIAIDTDITRTQEAIQVAMRQNLYLENNEIYSKRQASEMVGVTMESIRNWERNDLLPKVQPYQKRYYSRTTISRMYVIRLLLDTGYSMMAIKHFFQYYDQEKIGDAKQILIGPVDCEDLWNRADRYMETLVQLRDTSNKFIQLYEEMSRI